MNNKMQKKLEEFLPWYRKPDLSNMSSENIASYFKNMPDCVKMLDLSNNYLGDREVSILLSVALSLPSLHHLILNNNKLCKPFYLVLVALMKTIPNSIEFLYLSSNGLGKKSPDQLSAILASIQNSVKLLDLSNNKLNSQAAKSLGDVFASIPYTVNYLNLAGNNFGKLENLHLAWEKISNTTTSINLFNNKLVNKSAIELSLALSKLSDSITELILSVNKLGKHTGEDLASILGAIPETVNSLDLLGNKLYLMQEDLGIALQACSRGVGVLILSENKLGRLNGSQLQICFDKIHTNIQSLNLNSNELDRHSLAELFLILKTIPIWVNKINLRGNNLFKNKTAKQRDDFLNELFTTVNAERFDLKQNGAPKLDRFTRAIIPMFSALQAGYISTEQVIFTKDIAIKILGNLASETIAARAIKKIESNRDSLNPSSHTNNFSYKRSSEQELQTTNNKKIKLESYL